MRAWVLWLAGLSCPPAFADLFTAQLAYQKGDYERAFHDYRELAELGQPQAQYNLAIMYAKGRGARQSELNAYAWAKLAADSGFSGAQALVDQLRPQLAPGSEKIADEIRVPFSRAVLDARLMPKFEDNPALEDRCRHAHLHQSPRNEMEYPEEARHRGMQGHVIVRYTLMPDGSGRNTRIVYAVPAGYFERGIRSNMLHWHASPDPAAPPAECWLMYRFEFADDRLGGVPGFAKRVRVEAEAGDAGAQFTYGMLLANFPFDLRSRPSEAVPWFLKAAQQGSRDAQYALGASLLQGWGCRCEENKAEIWLRKAAEADQAAAQVTLATFALRGTLDEAKTKQASTWLERAARSGNPEGTLYLSALLAATPVERARDPRRALTLLKKVEAEFKGDPLLLEIRAAAEAAAGGFPQAVKSEKSALGLAKFLLWDTAPFQERLARYESSQPWYGNLLVF